MSSLELERTIPVRPPTVNKNRNPTTHSRAGSLLIGVPCNEITHLKILIPVGTAITIVAAVKYARVSTSSLTVNMWWAQTMKPRNPIESIA
jgi:hypothetical protein